MRRNTVIGNWKMNLTLEEADLFMHNFMVSEAPKRVHLGLCVPFTHIYYLANEYGHLPLSIGAQNCSQHKNGAYTGEVSAEMLASAGADSVIIGHSERRKYQSESEKELQQKIHRALEADLDIIYCLGETLEEREAGQLEAVLERQFVEGPGKFDKKAWEAITLAYEPVWAIGTGKTATPEQAEEVHAMIRQLLAEEVARETAEKTTILYGGSCKPKNAEQLFSQPNIDGGLIGGASLNETDFLAIADSF